MSNILLAYLLSGTLALASATAAPATTAGGHPSENHHITLSDIIHDAEGRATSIADSIVPVVSGNAELDAQLDLILDTVVGRDQDALRRAYEWVGNEENFPYSESDYVSSDEPWEQWSVRSALEMATTRTGNCYDYASLVCWIARALGYDARVVNGYVLMQSGWVLHGWVEVNQDGELFVIDPQQHAREGFQDLDLFMVRYDDAPLYYNKEL